MLRDDPLGKCLEAGCCPLKAPRENPAFCACTLRLSQWKLHSPPLLLRAPSPPLGPCHDDIKEKKFWKRQTLWTGCSCALGYFAVGSPRDEHKACSFLSTNRLCLCAGTAHLRELPKLPLAHSYQKTHPAVFWQVLFLQASQVLGPWHTTIGSDKDEHVRFCSFWNLASSSSMMGRTSVLALLSLTLVHWGLHHDAMKAHLNLAPGPLCWLWAHVCSEHQTWTLSFIFQSKKMSIFTL